MNWDTLIQPLGWTLLHFIWQGAVIAALYLLMRFALRKRSAQAKYLTGCIALASMALAPLITFQLEKGETISKPVPPSVSAVLVADSQPLPMQQASANEQPLPGVVNLVVASEPLGPVKIGKNLERAFPWVVAGWLCGVLFLSVRLLVGWMRLQKLRKTGISDVGEAIAESFSTLRTRLGLGRPIQLFQSALVQVPTVIGWLKPVILLPISTLSGLTHTQLEAILVHELAHIRRHDFLINFLQSLLETVLFYHPAVWWISKHVREEREHCCDDLTIEICGDRMNYARALAALEELRHTPADLALAASGGSLLLRIRRMLLPASEDTHRGPAWLSAVLVFGFVLLVALGSIVSARDADAPGKETGTNQVLQAARDISKGNFAKLETLREMSEKAHADFKQSENRDVFKPTRTAFEFLGNEAGKGNTNALEGLLRAVNMRFLGGHAMDALGTAAGLGNETALKALLEPEKHGILLSSAVGALKPAAERNNPKAVAFLAGVIRDPKLQPLRFLAGDGLNEAAAQGNETAIEALVQLSEQSDVALDGLIRAANNGNAKAEAAMRKRRASSLLQFRLVSQESIPGETEELDDPSGGTDHRRKIHVRKEVFLDETYLLEAHVGTSPLNTNRYEIDVQLTPAGRRIFAALTKENIGKRLAIVFDGNVLMAPTMQSEITSGQLPISGRFTKQEAEAIAGTLNAAAKANPGKEDAPVTAPITFVSLKTNENVFQFIWRMTPQTPMLRNTYMLHSEGWKPAGYWGVGARLEEAQDSIDLILEVEPQETHVLYRLVEKTASGQSASAKTIPVPKGSSLLILYDTKPGQVSNQDYSALWHGVWLRGAETLATDSFTSSVFTENNPGMIRKDPDHYLVRVPSSGAQMFIQFETKDTAKQPSGKFREVDVSAVVDGEPVRFQHESNLTLLRQMLNLVQSASVHRSDPSLVNEWNQIMASSNRLHLKIEGGISQVLPVDQDNAHRVVEVSEILLAYPGAWPDYIYIKEGTRIFAFSKYDPSILNAVGWGNLIKLDGTNGVASPSLTIHKGPLAWERETPYTTPNFERFFPDDIEGGARLDALWEASDKDQRSDAEILMTVRSGLRHTKQHRTAILRWIGNKYIWNKPKQNPEAIEIMYHAADFSGPNADPYGTRHYAVYFGLSVVTGKTPAILRTLADLAVRVDDPNDLDRIAWGCASQRQELLKHLQPHLKSSDAKIRGKAEVVEKIFKGELKAFEWAKDQARQKAELNFRQELPRLRNVLLEGNSSERAGGLETILRNRIALIMDDSFIAAFAQCATDPLADNRDKVAVIAGDKWVWSAKEQNPEAIALMLKLSHDPDHEVRYNAVYYGLSTVRKKSDAVVDRLLEIASEGKGGDLKQRIFWGLRGDKEQALRILDQHIGGSDPQIAERARVLKSELVK